MAATRPGEEEENTTPRMAEGSCSASVGEQDRVVEAAGEGTVEELELLLDQHAGEIDINAWSSSGSTALSLAAAHGELAVVRCLLARGAAVNALTLRGGNPAHEAAANGHCDVMTELVAAGADLTTADHFGRTALQYARAGRHDDLLEAFPVLVVRACVVAVAAGDDRRAAGLMEILRDLADSAADLTLPDDDNKSPLRIAQESDCAPVLEAWPKLMTRVRKASPVAQPSKMVKRRMSVLQMKARTKVQLEFLAAASDGRLGDLRLLVDAHANEIDLDAPASVEDGPALVQSAARGWSEVVEVLLDMGADPEVMTLQGSTAAEQAVVHNHVGVLRVLADAGAHMPRVIGGVRQVLPFAEEQGFAELVGAWQDLLARSDVGKQRRKQRCQLQAAFVEAAAAGSLEKAEQLLTYPEVHIDGHHRTGDIALTAAAGSGHTSMVAALLTWGAAVDKANKFGNSAACVAAYNNAVGALRALVEAGADLMLVNNCQNPEEWMEERDVGLVLQAWNDLVDQTDSKVERIEVDWQELFVAAAEDGDAEKVAQLLENHASDIDIDGASNNEETAMLHAISNGDVGMARVLLQLGAHVDAHVLYLTTGAMFAAAKDQLDILELLVEAGADLGFVGLQEKNAYMFAVANNSQAVLAEWPSLMARCKKGEPAPAAPVAERRVAPEQISACNLCFVS